MELEQLQNYVPWINYFVDRRCFPDWEIIKQKIQFHDLTFVVEGKSTYYVNDVQYDVEAGDVIYIPLGNVREAYTDKENPMHSYAFNFNWEPGSPTPLPLQTVTKNVITNEIYGYIKQFTQVWMGKQPGYILQSRALFMLILHRLLVNSYLQNSHQSDQRINRILEYVSEHYPEELHLSDMAKLVNLHPVYLGKLFKKNTGYSFKEYVNLIRINHAEMLLSTGGFSVTQIADRCGFHDISYFSNVFKAIKGYPPSARRNEWLFLSKTKYVTFNNET
ncbi:AraC family transcriptional regulator [Cohnella sp. AR92]|uniref:AraC family transcriptional regulator n=1 Tax=Cohnella sp. AR92 TaxID=648716 RepID=UPI000F8C9246|nr:AraC family transcriptional regulator [Cohnella sp. AR92]RUS45870.1 AraC family transcriptional regulator [Cohnella sp. AR92]